MTLEDSIHSNWSSGSLGPRITSGTPIPLRHLRARSGRKLTLYYHGYDRDQVAERGFTEPTQHAWEKEKTPAGVELTCMAAPPPVVGEGSQA